MHLDRTLGSGYYDVERSRFYLQDTQTKDNGEQPAACFFWFVTWKSRMSTWSSMQRCVPLSILNTKAPLIVFFSALKYTVNLCYILVYGT